MRTRRILGASLTTLLTVGMVGAAMPSATAGDNDRRDWDDKRVVKTPDAAGGALHLLGGRNVWSMAARELGADTDTWRLRESRSGQVGYTKPLSAPRDVQRFRYDESQRQDSTYAAFEKDGRLHAGTHLPNAEALVSTDLAAVADSAEAPKVVASEHDRSHALIAQAGTWYLHVGEAGRWVSAPDPNLDSVPGNEGEDYAFVDGTDNLAVFWNAPNGDLRVATGSSAPIGESDTTTTLTFAEPHTVATGGAKYVDYVETSLGGRLVTQATNGSITLWEHADRGQGEGLRFYELRELAGPVTSGEPITEPQVAVDPRHATLTVGWKEPRVTGGGLMLWQEDRPLSTYLERPTFVTGTRDTSQVSFVASPQGSLTVAFRRSDENAVVRVKHLPAGKAKWTDGIRLVSPKPITDTSAAWALGPASAPVANGDVRLAVNDTVGVYGFRFDAPRPYTKVTRPVRKTQKVKTYRIKANTSWAFADNWEFRMRRDKGKRYGAWKTVAVAEGENSKVVTRPRGQKWCYQAKAFLGDRQVTKWSEQKCVSVRR